MTTHRALVSLRRLAILSMAALLALPAARLAAEDHALHSFERRQLTGEDLAAYVVTHRRHPG